MLTKAEVTIERPRDEVFRRFADELATTYPLICPFTTSVRMDPEKPMAARATGQMMVRNLFMPAIVDFTVTRYEKGERLSIEARHGSRSSRSDYLFRDAGTGGRSQVAAGTKSADTRRARPPRRPAPQDSARRSAEGAGKSIPPINGSARADRLGTGRASRRSLCHLSGALLLSCKQPPTRQRGRLEWAPDPPA